MAESVEGAKTPASASVFVRQATGLVRELSWFDTFIMVLGMPTQRKAHPVLSL